MNRSYDLIAPIYDNLANLIYGKALREAQTFFLYLIPSTANVLVAGGGTGWILEEMASIHPQGLQIDYVDVSAKMIALAKQRNVGDNKVNFIQQSILNFTCSKQYDVIITPFFFDNFKQQTAGKAFTILHKTLKPNGLWLYTDFQIQNKHAYWQKALLFSMYSFFRVAANIEAAQLPDVVFQFIMFQYQPLESKTFLHQFIITSAYQKLKTQN